MEAASLQTFIFADLAGFTALTEAHGDERAADAAASFCEAVRPLLADHGAHEIKALGDALMLRVPEASSAVELAREIVLKASGRHGVLAVRVGMHTGPAVCRGGDWFGATVNLAARVADQAVADEVLMTHASLAAAGEQLDALDVRPLGRRHLKNVAEPVELFALVVASEHVGRGMPIDPVCRMAVDPGHAHASHVWRGVRYHFCSQACEQTFQADPARHLRRRSVRGPISGLVWQARRLQRALRRR